MIAETGLLLVISVYFEVITSFFGKLKYIAAF